MSSSSHEPSSSLRPTTTSFAPTSPTLTPSRSREPSTSTSTSTSTRPRVPQSTLLTTPSRPTLTKVTEGSSSPIYTTSTRSRHSLYGIEDRIIFDFGSRIWKIGFSTESNPRLSSSVLEISNRFELDQENNDDVVDQIDGLWGLEKGSQREDEWELKEQRFKNWLRNVWYTCLMTDPKQRKIIIVENPLLSTRIKNMIARVLFDNLQVPSINFASAPVLALLATGRSTGLVVDIGHLETTIIPVYHSRPLFSQILSTPRAGSKVNSRLRSLLLEYGIYAHPPISLTSTITPVIGKIPKNVLSEELIESIKTRCCFIDGELDEGLGEVDEHGKEERMEIDLEESNIRLTKQEKEEELRIIKRMERIYSKRSTSTTISFRIPGTNGIGKGWLQIPGWIRERCFECLFEEGDEDEFNLQSLILESLLRLPIDLRRPLASSILLTGGTSCTPGLFPRLFSTLLKKLSASTPPNPNPNLTKAHQKRLSILRTKPHYASLIPLLNEIKILNIGNGIPDWSPGLMSWIGGSLAGTLKSGGEEIKKENWDEISEKNETRSSGEVFGVVEGGKGAAVEVEGKAKGIEWVGLGL